MTVENNERGVTPDVKPSNVPVSPVNDGEVKDNDVLADRYLKENNNQAFAKMRIQTKESQAKIAELESKLAEKEAQISSAPKDGKDDIREQFEALLKEKEEAKLKMQMDAKEQAKKDVDSLKEQGFSEADRSTIINLRVKYTKDLDSAISLFKEKALVGNSQKRLNAEGNFNSQGKFPQGNDAPMNNFGSIGEFIKSKIK